jgi:hypothetical protein
VIRSLKTCPICKSQMQYMGRNAGVGDHHFSVRMDRPEDLMALRADELLALFDFTTTGMGWKCFTCDTLTPPDTSPRRALVDLLFGGGQ